MTDASGRLMMANLRDGDIFVCQYVTKNCSAAVVCGHLETISYLFIGPSV